MVYSEPVIQSSHKNYHFGNFRTIIVRYLKCRRTLVKEVMPSYNSQFSAGANLNHFIVDGKHSTFPLGK